uniref:Riboflavin kinase n=1 Tax=Castor canadensis TaxID=51338 RepID=A0A8C0ZL70_CASCN
MRSLPYFCRGQVVRGFGRGSKQLGIPTANFPEQVVDSLPADVSTGIYYGWASVGSGDVHKMVVSIGWNPYYKNMKKSMETHIMHTFKEDFYGEILNVAIVGYLRPEKNFDSLGKFLCWPSTTVITTSSNTGGGICIRAFNMLQTPTLSFLCELILLSPTTTI